MSTHKHIDRICVVITVLSLLLTLLFMNGQALGLKTADRSRGYEDTLFDTSRVHSIDIVIQDWDAFLETCESETYSVCSVVIDGKAIKNVAIRGKGNTSLSSVKAMGSQRYSFKLEFDRYEGGKTCSGLDKLSLNNIIQDNTYMKDYLVYRLMGEFGADSPLCSFAYITVNGEDWGLYLAVEGVEDSFLQRNYGRDAGDLYKPDSMSFGGGGPGNGKNFNMDDFLNENAADADPEEGAEQNGERPERGDFGDFGGFGGFGGGDFGGMTPPEGFDPSESGEDGESGGRGRGGFDFGGVFGGMGSADVKLQYIDSDPDSYSNIFDNAKTDLTQADKTRLIQSLKKLSRQEDLESVVDVDEVIRYFVVHNYVCNGDSYTGSIVHNYYLHEKDGQLSMIPWDYNLAFGTFQGSDAAAMVNDPIDSPMSVSSAEDRPMWGWIVSGEEYTALYHEYFAEFLDTVDIRGIIDEAYELIKSYVEKDPTAFCTYEEFETGVETLREFCRLRTESVRGQLEGRIPSTSQGQRTDSGSLIDAGSITLSDMGSMGGGRGGFGGGFSFSGSGGAVQGGEGQGASGFPGGSFPGGQSGQGGPSFPGGQGGEGQGQGASGFPGGSFPGGQSGQGGFSFPGGQGGEGEGQGASGFPGGSFPGGQSGQGGPSFPGGQGGGGGFSFPGGQGGGGQGQGSSGFPGGSFPGGQSGQGGPSFPGGQGGGGGSPSGMGSASPAPSGGSLLLVGLSAAVLLLGILIAAKYKRY